ncbi:uncharacterized protein LOC132194571 [Neocloeon triangulifer]|uniref:uncharacterized protein LOC132194571 n=1 Tax=Neocloeon triangulifer TaxID=2078957 RepID=UPI00286ED9AF|nr:uncharacterized protein LOC132194571 [Neocloeon triangulifer]
MQSKNWNLIALVFLCLIKFSKPQVRSSCQLSGYAQRSSFLWQSSIFGSSRQIKCFSECASDAKSGSKIKRDFSSMQFYFERVYNPRRISVNCDLTPRFLVTYCNLMLKRLAVPQIGTRRYFFVPTFEMSYFEALKFCRSRNLLLGVTDIKSKEQEIIALLATTGNLDPTGKAKFWGDSRAQNGTYLIDGNAQCSAFSVEKSGAFVKTDETCKTKLKFFCDVPSQCYAEICNAATGLISRPETATTFIAKSCSDPTCPKCGSNNPPTSADGISKTYCGKNYFISTTTASFEEAMGVCCSKKMNLLTIESEADINCVSDLFRDREVKRMDKPEFWTSATSNGCPGRFSWCTAPFAAVPKWLWAEAEPLQKNCVVASLTPIPEGQTYSEVALNTRDCAQQSKFICMEPGASVYENAIIGNKSCNQECFSGKCQSKAIAGSFNFRASSPGVAGPIKTACGFNYYIGKSTRSWQESENACCEDRMELVSVSDETEIECIRELLGILNDNWRSGPFWVGGTDVNCALNFTWCSAYNPRLPFSTRQQRIVRLNNRKGSSCIALDLNPAKTGLVAYKCDQMYRYICRDPRNCLPQCPTACPLNAGKSAAMEAARSLRIKRQAATADDEDEDSDKKGTEQHTGIFNSINACGRNYLISEDMRTYSDAYSQCCTKNMRLLSLDNKNEGDCLMDLLKSPGKDTTFWTSATDYGCKGYFVWCGTGEYFNAVDHGKARITAGDNKDCILLEYDYKKKFFSLKDEVCSLKQKFICEPAN